MRKIILPGDVVFDGVLRIPNTYVEDGKTYASVVGMLDDENKFIPLEAQYTPTNGDMVVGIVVEAKPIVCVVELSLPTKGIIITKFNRLKLDLGDVVYGRIAEIKRDGTINITNVKKLPYGKLVKFPPAKIPRLIGKKNSMLSIIKKGIKGDIIVGNNGYVWVSDDADIPLFLRIINKIIMNAHKSGLTDSISRMVESRV